ncbi:MAG: M48 family metallopeptidase [Alphaproteobacteria bacterium]|nr:M48 family metallopeptidase [Alphaproteobacteria bacterium]
MARYPARYYDGLTARSRPVEVEIAATGLAIFDEAGPLVGSWPGEGVRLVEKPREGEPVRLGLAGTTARLVVDDPEIVAPLRQAGPHLLRRHRTSRRTVVRIALWAVLAAGSLAGIVLVLIPLLSAQLAAVTPESAKFRLGQAVLLHIAELLPGPAGPASRRRYCSGEDGQAALQRLADRLAADLPDPPTVRVVVVNTLLVNAFALPGGIMVFTRGLLVHARSPEEIAGIAAHELGHIAHDHSTRALYRSFAVALLIGVLFGDLTGGALAGGLAEWLVNTGYSRDAERDADAFALERLKAAGIGTEGLEDFFVRLEEKHGTGGGPLLRLLSTHPGTAERLAHIRAAGHPGSRPAMSEEDWTYARQTCLTLQTAPPLL